VVLTSTIVGGELSLAPGVALAQKMLGTARESSPASSATARPAKASSTSR
jgi:TPP-dependent pyruvate/acetoin dehydrogenase alpha subunit